ncbi:cell division protein FtsA [Altererythrobacter sp. MTPC7]|uniref:cell division protein FtsA n=1 Tax=Altererythrobacter sp. MTPC7 TaxID=3056567 RepID=UPI0036F25A5D
MGLPRISRVFGAINIGSFRISAMILGQSESGELIVLGSGHRASQGVRRGYIVDMAAATYAVRDVVERAEKAAGTGIASVWVGCSGAGLANQVSQVEVPIGGRRIEEEDIQHLLVAARETIQPDGKMVLHAQPAQYTLDGAHGASDPVGLHAERLGVDIHVMLADGAPVKNLRDAVESAHLSVEAVVAAPIACAEACLSPEERELGTALVEIGAELTNVSIFQNGMLRALHAIPIGSGDITDAIAGDFGIRRFQAERLKCVFGSAIASPSDHREMVPLAQQAEGAPEVDRVSRAELVSVVTGQLSRLTDEINRVFKAHETGGARSSQVVLTGGGAELAGIAEFAQGALGRPVRIGKPSQLRGLPDAHATPGFTTLAGLCLYAARDPVDIRSIPDTSQTMVTYSGLGLIKRVLAASREYF